MKQSAVVDVLLYGEEIHRYDDDKPFPSALFLGFDLGKPLHVIAAFDADAETAFVITAYEPTLDYFEDDFKTRKRRSEK
jgi:hypothetical protein